MIGRQVFLNSSVSIVITTLKEVPSNLFSIEWYALEDRTTLLKPFTSVTTELSSEQLPTISKVMLQIRGSHFCG